jgi:hypothetical protein
MKIKLDANHHAVISWYQQMFCSVADCAASGWRTPGCPDLFVGCCGITEPVEIKTEEGELTASQQRFIDEWRGSKVRLVRSIGDVAKHVIEIRAKAARLAA